MYGGGDTSKVSISLVHSLSYVNILTPRQYKVLRLCSMTGVSVSLAIEQSGTTLDGTLERAGSTMNTYTVDMEAFGRIYVTLAHRAVIAIAQASPKRVFPPKTTPEMGPSLFSPSLSPPDPTGSHVDVNRPATTLLHNNHVVFR